MSSPPIPAVRASVGTEPSSWRSRPSPVERSSWWVLGAAIVVQMMTAPGQTVGVSAFVDHLVDDLDLTRSSVSTAYLIGTLAGAASMTAAGRFIDRRGVRQAVAVFGASFGLVLVAMSGVVSVVTLAVGFAGTRALGQGALTLTASTSVAVSFDRRRGTAMGLLSGMGGALMSLVPLVATGLIAVVGWRWAWVVLGVVVWAVLLPLARTRVFAGGATRAVDPVDQRIRPEREGWTALEARRTWAFWVVAAAVCLGALVPTGLMFHHVALLAERGLGPAEAAANFLPQTLAGVGAALATGRLADRVSERLLLPGALLVLAAAPLLVQVVAPGVSVVLYGVTLGTAMTSIRAVEATLLPRWFGTAHIGEIRGITMAATVAGSAFGPLPLALAAEHLGSYAPTLAVFTMSALGLAAIAAATRPPAPSVGCMKGRPSRRGRVRSAR